MKTSVQKTYRWEGDNGKMVVSIDEYDGKLMSPLVYYKPDNGRSLDAITLRYPEDLKLLGTLLIQAADELQEVKS